MKILDQSLKYALQMDGTEDKFNVFSFIWDKNRLISVGRNCMTKTSKKAFDFGRRYDILKWIEFPFKHSEVDALSKLWGRTWITGKEKIVVVRLNKAGEPVLAKPCSDCSTLLSALNIRKIWWTTEDGWEFI